MLTETKVGMQERYTETLFVIEGRKLMHMKQN